MDGSDFNSMDFHAGDHVVLAEDDWGMVGIDLVVVDAEPVPGSSQCVIKAGEDILTVSRGSLRRV